MAFASWYAGLQIEGPLWGVLAILILIIITIRIAVIYNAIGGVFLGPLTFGNSEIFGTRRSMCFKPRGLVISAVQH